MLPTIFSLLCLAAVSAAQQWAGQQWPPVVRQPQQRQQPSSHLLAGNVGVYGSGSGDAYAGRLGDGLYGVGTRFSGNVGVAGGVGYAGGQVLRGKRAIVTGRVIGSARGETTRTDDLFLASGSVKGAANLGFGDESREESAETATQTSSTSTDNLTTSKQEKVTTKRPLKAACAPRRLRAGR